MKINQSVSVVILAAGNSSRMNAPKPFLPFDDGRNFIEKIIDSYITAGIRDVIIVINESMERRLSLILEMNYPTFNIKVVVNRFPERGRFYSIQLGLGKVKSRFSFIQNIDNPFTTKGLLTEMKNLVTDTNYVVPVFHKKDGHPVLLGNHIVAHLLSLTGDDQNLRIELIKFSKINLIWPFEDILANINSREDYRKYFLLSEVAL